MNSGSINLIEVLECLYIERQEIVCILILLSLGNVFACGISEDDDRVFYFHYSEFCF